MEFGKISGGVLIHAPNPIIVNGKRYFNPTAKEALLAGYKPIQRVPAPVVAAGYHALPKLIDDAHAVICDWQLVQDAPEEPSLAERTAAVVDYNVMMGVLEDPEV